MSKGIVTLPAFPFDYLIVSDRFPALPRDLIVTENVQIPGTDYRLLEIYGMKPDVTTPNLSYVLGNTLAAYWHVMTSDYMLQQVIGGLVCVHAWLCIIPQICYNMGDDTSFKPPRIVGFRPPPIREKGPVVDGGIENKRVMPREPVLHALYVTMPATGSLDQRCMVQLEQAADIQREMFMTSDESKPDYVTTSMLLGRFKSDKRRRTISGIWLVFPARATQIMEAIRSRINGAIVHTTNTKYSW